eukprot:scaffold277731_cov30-Tisochrysis_lutea.AAC.2
MVRYVLDCMVYGGAVLWEPVEMSDEMWRHAPASLFRKRMTRCLGALMKMKMQLFFQRER